VAPVAFTRDDIISALEELAQLLAAADVTTTIRVVGGAALSVLHGRDTTTTDIDALYGAPDQVRAAVATIAAQRGWPDTWLNGDVAMFASHFDHTATWVPFTSRGGVKIWMAPADLLPAMKLLAGRGRRDGADIDLLCDACGVTSITEAEVTFDRYYPRDEIVPVLEDNWSGATPTEIPGAQRGAPWRGGRRPPLPHHGGG
jgi:hypothetical protein